MSIDFRMLPGALAALLSVSLIGCGSGSKTDAPPVSIEDAEASTAGETAHAHAETYPEAVAELDGMRAAIETAFAANDLTGADGPIHEVGHVLEELVAMAKKAELGDEAVTAIEGAVETLFDSFTAVDEKIHGGEGKDYSDVKAEVDAAFAVLRQYLPKQE